MRKVTASNGYTTAIAVYGRMRTSGHRTLIEANKRHAAQYCRASGFTYRFKLPTVLVSISLLIMAIMLNTDLLHSVHALLLHPQEAGGPTPWNALNDTCYIKK